MDRAELAYPRGIIPVEQAIVGDAFDEAIKNTMLPDSQDAIRQGVDLYIQRLHGLGKGPGPIGRALDWVFNIQRGEEIVHEYDEDIVCAPVRQGVSFALGEIGELYRKDPYRNGLFSRKLIAFAIALLANNYLDRVEEKNRVRVFRLVRELDKIAIDRTKNYNDVNISRGWVIDNVDLFFFNQKIGIEELRGNLVKFINLDDEVLVKTG